MRKEKIDVNIALSKLKNLIGADTLLLEGGSIINSAFLRGEVVDELSLVMAPVIADKNDKPLFMDSKVCDFKLINTKIRDDVIILNYKRA